MIPNYQNCTLCPRMCGVDRAAGELGYCRMPGQVRAARAALHYWEEPVISGERGSGAVFFSGCTLRCRFCQNYEISTLGKGFPLSSGRQWKPVEDPNEVALDQRRCELSSGRQGEVVGEPCEAAVDQRRRGSSARLREIFERLIAEGAHNVNLVTPTQFLPDILPALTPKLPVPVVYNCGGYERVETLRALEGLVDVWLPDLKYSDNALARRLSGAGDYVQTAQAAILEMYRQTGPCVIEDGLLKKGVLIRHLILPGHIENSLGVLDWIAQSFPRGAVTVSLMSQYTPAGAAASEPPFDRRITREEYDAVLSWLYLDGLTAGFTQGPEAASLEFVPEFDGLGIIVDS